MVDGIERFLPEDGEHSGSESADQKGTEEAGGVSNSDTIDVVFGQVGVIEGFVNYGEDSFEMGAGGDFRNDTTIGGENIDLGDNDVAEDLAVIRNDRGGGFVTGTFDGENIHIIYYTIFYIIFSENGGNEGGWMLVEWKFGATGVNDMEI